MKVLIVGLGYAGNRFLNAFRSIESIFPVEDFKYAYVDIERKDSTITSFSDTRQALELFNPDIVVVSTTDGEHFSILKQLDNYNGFVICEKPIVKKEDDIDTLRISLRKAKGFCMDLVERYSMATQSLKKHIEKRNLRPIRINFIWGKDRIHDHRRTTGAVSEIIHALDLSQYIAGKGDTISIQNAIGVKSDFSISGDSILDSISFVGNMGKCIVSGYSSFVNIERQRTVDFIFESPENELVYARLTYDTPCWDSDHIKIWEHKAYEDVLIEEFTSHYRNNTSNLQTIQKLRLLTEDVCQFLINGREPSVSFASLEESITLQKTLNQIESYSFSQCPKKYSLKNIREIFTDNKDLETMG